ncbi:MAG: hypothetical protein DI498_11435 [Paracoccus denitrificans]|nr:MAG: hypothetical protein DI498_11435 [Paracoccus denitrificans]PZO83474.1 MAG: hypothetical protein DI633_11435 [Paracoccus denitrificans]
MQSIDMSPPRDSLMRPIIIGVNGMKQVPVFSGADTDRGFLFQFGETGHGLIQNDVESHVIGNKLISALKQCIYAFTSNAALYNLNIVADKNREYIEGNLVHVWTEAQENALKQKETWILNEAKYTQIPQSKDERIESDYRAKFESADQSHRLQFLMTWPEIGLFAVARMGREFWGMSEPDWRIGTDRVLAANLMASDTLTSTMLAKPSLGDVLARGVDQDAMRAYVEDALRQFKERRQWIEDTRLALTYVVKFVAVACDISDEDAFAMLSGRGNG